MESEVDVTEWGVDVKEWEADVMEWEADVASSARNQNRNRDFAGGKGIICGPKL